MPVPHPGEGVDGRRERRRRARSRPRPALQARRGGCGSSRVSRERRAAGYYAGRTRCAARRRCKMRGYEARWCRRGRAAARLPRRLRAPWRRCLCGREASFTCARRPRLAPPSATRSGHRGTRALARLRTRSKIALPHVETAVQGLGGRPSDREPQVGHMYVVVNFVKQSALGCSAVRRREGLAGARRGRGRRWRPPSPLPRQPGRLEVHQVAENSRRAAGKALVD